MGFISTILIGALTGWIAGKIMKLHGGFIQNMVVGIIGSFVGGFIFQLLGFGDIAAFSLPGVFIGVVGACICIAVARIITK